jgi:hypothetical protein
MKVHCGKSAVYRLERFGGHAFGQTDRLYALGVTQNNHLRA